MTTVAVAGGTGLVGRHVVEELERRGHAAVVLSRAKGVDLITGDGLGAALAGAEVAIDVTDIKTLLRTAALGFFETATRALLAAERQCGVRHHVMLSIVGIDDVDTGYYAGKRRQEEVVTAARAPMTILRATQFHEFPAQALRRGTLGPFALVPRMRSQPIAVREVARALVDAGLGEPAGRLPDLAGPRVEEMTDLARRLVRAQGRRTAVVPIRLPGAAGAAMANGGLLPRGAGPRGTQSFEQWLSSDDARPWL